MINTYLEVPVKKTHKEWRKEVKKIRRKRVRQKKAKERDLRIEEEHKNLLQNTHYQIWLRKQAALESFQQEVASRERDSNEEKWLRRELLAQKKFQEEKKRHEALEAIKEKERLRIQQEFEEQQKLVRLRIEEKKRLAEEKQRKHELLLETIQDYINGESELPDELRESADTNPGKEPCPFFIKTAACRFGDKCSRNHSRPGISRILLLAHFFSNIRLEQPSICEYGSDLALEFSETELYRDYDNFFVDVTEELRRFGQLHNFQTCKNFEAHLRGNVYVEFGEERHALRAYQQLQGRYYAGKRINVEFCKLRSWKAAICGNRYNSRDPVGERSQRQNVAAELITSTNPSSSWNEDDTKTRRNWRWSESPEHDIRRPESRNNRKNGSRSSTQSRSNSKRSSRSSSRSQREDHSRSSSRRQSKDRERNSSHCKDHESSSSHSKNRKRDRRSRSKSKEKKKKRRRKRSKSKSKEKRSKRSK